ncbi:MAG TPA: POTRA domain-containing protein [Terriglobales bacterium]|nr:POTRA domain-containing protein [Terriglobales bacterium]
MANKAWTIFIGGAILSQMVFIGPSISHAQRTSRTTKQETASQKAKLVAVHAEGSKRSIESDVIAYTGLKTGEIVGPEDFKQAADKLMACGAFDEVRYKYGPAGTGYTVTFTLADSEQFLPVAFDNFVWFSDQELTDKIRESVPLFRGAVATGGEMLQQVSDALQNLLAQRGIPGTVRFVQEGSFGVGDHEGAITGGLFIIDGVEINIRELKFPGTAQADGPMLQDALKSLLAMPYQRSAVRALANDNLHRLYAKRGFLKARVGEVSIELIGSNPREPEVVVNIPVEPGAEYTLSGIRWIGLKAFNTEDLQRLMSAKKGMPVDGLQLDTDLDRIRETYGRKGYLRAEVTVNPTFDDEQRTVAFDIQVREGDLYRFKSIDLDGLDRLTLAKLREAWTMREGEPFDAGYEREYIKAIRPMLAQNISVSVDNDRNDETKMVEVTMHFEIHANKVVREKSPE